MKKGNTQTGQAGRDAKGRFGSGNQFGRLRRSTDAADYMRAFRQAVSPEALGDVVDAMIDRAKRGNVSAARLLIEHCIGKPIATFNMLTDDEYRVAGETPLEHHERLQQYIAKRVVELRAAKVRNETPKESSSNGQRYTLPTCEQYQNQC